MAKTEAFDKHYLDYENWFENNRSLYEAELKSLKKLIGKTKNGLEIGIGTGRFAIPTGIKIGIEPSEKMRKIALSKGLNAINAAAENLPFDDASFDFAIMITTVCFVDNVLKSFQEAYRVIKANGFLIVGYVDKESKLGIEYQKRKAKSKFYKSAEFYSAKELLELLKKAGFSCFELEAAEKTENSFIFIKAIK